MRKLFRILIEVTADALFHFVYFVKHNLMNFANILNLLIPYVMYFVGQKVMFDRGAITVGGEIFLPMVFVVVIYYLRSAANKIGKGITIPIPDKRFTQVDDDGEVSVAHKRIQEMLLYVADLEDWLERKGLL